MNGSRSSHGATACPRVDWQPVEKVHPGCYAMVLSISRVTL